MKIRNLVVIATLALVSACATKPYDYTNLIQHKPKSILVLPPLNKSTDVAATYGYLSTVSRPIGELGYYVFPVEIVDQFMKEQGLPTAGEMHQVSLKKFAQIINPDAVMYITVNNYGTKFHLIDSVTVVDVEAKLIHTRTGSLLWEGRGRAQQNANAGQSNGLLGALITSAVAQAVNTSVDAAHDLSAQLNTGFYSAPGRGLLPGPYHPKYGQKAGE